MSTILTSFTPGRAWRVVLAVCGAAWSLFLLPPQTVEWMGSGTPRWLAVANNWAVYDAARDALVAAGTHDFYLVFGAASSLSLLMIGLALTPDLVRSGRVGIALSVVTLGGSVIVVLSYLNHDVDAPLHPVWGGELFVLVAIGLLGLAAAMTFAKHGWRQWTRVVWGLTPVILSLSLLVFGYWPHGPFIGFGVEAAVLIAAAPRGPGAERATRPASPGRSSRAIR